MTSPNISFLAGAVTSAALIYVYQSLVRNECKQRVLSSPTSSESTTPQSPKKSDTLMDSLS